MERTNIGIGIVGEVPNPTGSLAEMVEAQPGFDLLGICGEGTEVEKPEYSPAPWYTDFNVMIEDPFIQAIVVAGPIELRHDFMLRALNAGRHVLAALPFTEDAAAGVRVMKTALNAGLVATAFLPWRNEPGFASLLEAVQREDLRPIQQAFAVRECSAETWPQEAIAALDQVNMLVRQDVASVTAHVGASGTFLTAPLRDGGIATVRLGPVAGTGLPSWSVTSTGVTATVTDGAAVVTKGDDAATHDPPEAIDFWANLHAAIAGRAEIACHPVDIVRAMRLAESAIESAETGEPATV